MLCATDIIEGC